MKIHIGTDHAGFEMKNKLVELLKENGHEVFDHGASEFNEKDDYPDFIRPVAEAVSKDPESRGIILGGSGQGEAIVANRTVGVRAGVFYGGDIKMIKLLREHNNANVLSIGARFISESEAIDAVKHFLEIPFPADDRHVRRINKIDR